MYKAIYRGPRTPFTAGDGAHLVGLCDDLPSHLEQVKTSVQGGPLPLMNGVITPRNGMGNWIITP